MRRIRSIICVVPPALPHGRRYHGHGLAIADGRRVYHQVVAVAVAPVAAGVVQAVVGALLVRALHHLRRTVGVHAAGRGYPPGADVGVGAAAG